MAEMGVRLFGYGQRQPGSGLAKDMSIAVDDTLLHYGVHVCLPSNDSRGAPAILLMIYEDKHELCTQTVPTHRLRESSKHSRLRIGGFPSPCTTSIISMFDAAHSISSCAR